MISTGRFTAVEPWWTRGWLIALLTLAGAVPLLWPSVPPLVDLLGHMGRYGVQLDLATSPVLRQWYGFQWTLIPNLGVDLLIEGLGPLLGLEPAVKLIVMAIPVLQGLGFIFVARVAHGRVPATAWFTLPLAFGYPFHYGFVNFTLSVALAFLAFALWMWLGQRGRIVSRALLFVPLSFLIWLCHIYGWAVFCVLAGADELMRRRLGEDWPRALCSTAISCLSLLTPMLVTALWAAHASQGQTRFFFKIGQKLGWIAMMLRDRWAIWDIAGALLILTIMLWGLFSRRTDRHAGLVLATATFALLFILMPSQLVGSAQADMRLVPFMCATGLLAFSPSARVPMQWIHRLAVAGVAFTIMRLAGTTASLALYDRVLQQELTALKHVPNGARMVTMVWKDCPDVQGWMRNRVVHIGSLALVRRHAFANDQWQMPGGQLIDVHFREAGAFQRDPSQKLSETRCSSPGATHPGNMDSKIPKSTFDYVWVIQPRILPPMHGWREIWRNGTSRLFTDLPPIQKTTMDRHGVGRF